MHLIGKLDASSKELLTVKITQDKQNLWPQPSKRKVLSISPQQTIQSSIPTSIWLTSIIEFINYFACSTRETVPFIKMLLFLIIAVFSWKFF